MKRTYQPSRIRRKRVHGFRKRMQTRRGPERSQATAGQGPQADRSLDAVEVAVSARTGRFQQADRLRRSAEFRRVTQHGRRAAGGAFVVLVAPRAAPASEPARCRLGVTVSRKVGGAVVRNRVKRRVREWFRGRRGSLGSGLDWIVIARAPAAGLAQEAAEDELSRLSRAALRSHRAGRQDVNQLASWLLVAALRAYQLVSVAVARAGLSLRAELLELCDRSGPAARTHPGAVACGEAARALSSPRGSRLRPAALRQQLGP